MTCAETLTYCRRARRNTRSNQRKKGRNRTKPPSAASCPFATGLRSEAHRTGVRIRATTTDRSIAAMTVTENCR